MSSGGPADAVVELELEGDVGVVYLNRPHRLNAVNPELVDAILDAFDRVNRQRIKAVVLAGRGRAFCAGHDLKGPPDDPSTLWQRLDRLQEVTRRIRGLPVPVIAAVHGHAVGAGAEFAFGCDLVVAAQGTRFRFPEVGLGLSITGGLSKLLPQLVGPLKAKELVLLGEPFEAESAFAWGLVNRVVPPESLLPSALDWAARLAGQPRTSTALAKSALDAGADEAFAAALSNELAHAIVTDAELRARGRDAALAASRARNVRP